MVTEIKVNVVWGVLYPIDSWEVRHTGVFIDDFSEACCYATWVQIQIEVGWEPIRIRFWISWPGTWPWVVTSLTLGSVAFFATVNLENIFPRQFLSYLHFIWTHQALRTWYFLKWPIGTRDCGITGAFFATVNLENIFSRLFSSYLDSSGT